MKTRVTWFLVFSGTRPDYVPVQRHDTTKKPLRLLSRVFVGAGPNGINVYVSVWGPLDWY
jgi:hypothetical protein